MNPRLPGNTRELRIDSCQGELDKLKVDPLFEVTGKRKVTGGRKYMRT